MLHEVATSDRRELLVLYGRRRLGKTALLRRFGIDQPLAFFSCPLSTAAEALRLFTHELARTFDDAVLSRRPLLGLERSARLRRGCVQQGAPAARAGRAAVSAEKRARHRFAAAARLGRARRPAQARAHRILVLDDGSRRLGSPGAALRAADGAARSAADVVRRVVRLPSGLVVRAARARLRGLRRGPAYAEQVARHGTPYEAVHDLALSPSGAFIPSRSSSSAKSFATPAPTSPSCTAWRPA